MAYNRHFINKRKSLKVNQINSSARISPPPETPSSFENKLPVQTIIEAARKIGTLLLVDYGLKEIPQDVYNINRPDIRRVEHEAFDNDQSKSWWEDVLLTKLDVSFNLITKITDDIKYLSNLLHLNLQSNNLKSIPDEISELGQLRYLNLCDNKIVTLPESIGTLNRLQHIYLGGNFLKYLPIEFCRLLALEVLDLSNNDFAYIPETIGNFIKLKHFSLANNKIKKLPETITKLKALTYLDISQNKLIEFPRLLDALFEILKLNVNLLEEFPIYRYTPSLKELNVDNNKIATMSTLHLSFIPNISVLTISKNCVTELPSEITGLLFLTHLDVSFNNLQSIPYALGNMESLEILSVNGNPFRSINRTAINSGTGNLKRYLRTRTSKDGLNFNVNSANQKPDESSIETKANSDINILNMDAHLLNSTGTVELSNCNLHEIPDNYFDIFKFKVVRSVLLAHNKLVEFPLGFLTYASTIVKFDISFNQLLELPNVFHNFSSLNYLNLNGNYLRSLPPSFVNLKNSLATLEVSHNPLGLELPAVIFQLTNLVGLNVSNCAIIKINADNFMKLHKLELLDLSNNEIEVIPPEFGLCQHIKTIHFDGNKLRHPTLMSINQGTEAILEYLRSQIQ